MSLNEASTTTLAARAQPIALAVFTGAVFTSAALLFAVQPLFAKMVLPVLGGSPGVWSVAMVFFQAMLLAGYAYAHVLTSTLTHRLSALVHLGVTGLAALWLPLAMAKGWGAPPADGEALWLLGLFAASIGLPFFALSANGPLLQAWFARTDHAQAKNPYVLYAASNVGSFLALFAYPFAIEPLTALGQQTFAWSQGFHLLIALLAACALLAMGGAARAETGVHRVAPLAPSLAEKATWTALAFVPSGLLVAVTQHLSTDVAAAPFMWVLPLGLFLATFVVVFQERPILPHGWMVRAQPALLILLAMAIAMPNLFGSLWLTAAIHLAAFFVTAMVCHGELAARRPHPAHLTGFYLWMSFGGMLGGVFSGLIAPHAFNWVVEYPLLLVAAVLCRPGLSWRAVVNDKLAHIGAGLGVALLAPAFIVQMPSTVTLSSIALGLTVALLALALAATNRPLRMALALGLALFTIRAYHLDTGDVTNIRSFFGVHRIVVTDDGRFRLLQHGTTQHGVQRLTDAAGKPETGRPEPLSYYHSAGPIGQAIARTRAATGGPIRVGAVGLGTGSVACYAEAGDLWRFYEIDAEVARLARTRFDFLPRCLPNAEIVLGDARLTLQDGEQGLYDLLIVDAFASDSIPVHLLTREAMAIYRRKVALGGTIVIHISNRHMDLAPVVASVAAEHGLSVKVNRYTTPPEGFAEKRFSVIAAVIAESPRELALYADEDGWIEEKPGQVRAWTDDYSNVLGAIIRHYWR